MKNRSELFKIFSSEVRLKVFEYLLEGRMCVSGIVDRLKVSQPTITQHLKILRQAGLVNAEKIGYWVHYSVNMAGLTRARNELGQFANDLKVKKTKCPVSVRKCPSKSQYK